MVRIRQNQNKTEQTNTTPANDSLPIQANAEQAQSEPMSKHVAASSAMAASKNIPPIISTKRKWLYRLIALVVIPLLALMLLEIVLRLLGYGYSTDYFLTMSESSQSAWVDNTHFGQWVFPRHLEPKPRPIPFVMPKQKTPGVCRIMVLGESAAMGYPDPSINFARLLELMLRERFPQTRFEVINTSMVAINSHVAYQIALQCADKEPDMFVVHLGNNEVIGPFGAAGVLGPFSPSLSMIRTSLAIKSTRLGQGLDAITKRMVSGVQQPQNWKGMTTFIGSRVPKNDTKLDRIRAHFRDNLQDICQIGIAKGIPVYVCTIPVNVRDCAPFGSEHSASVSSELLHAWDKAYQSGIKLANEHKVQEALKAFAEAEKIDDQYAELAYRMGQCYLVQNNLTAARKYLQLACDLDVLRFRTDSTINQVIHEVVAKYANSGVHLVDAVATFANVSPGALPGVDLFLEHVHMNFKGNYVLAQSVFNVMMQSPPAILGKPAAHALGELTEQQCRDRIGHAERNDWKIASVIHDIYTKMPPFTLQYDNVQQVHFWQQQVNEFKKKMDEGGLDRSLAIYRQAVANNGNDWMIRMKLADVLAETGKLEEAAEEYRRILSLISHHHAVYYVLGNVEMGLKNMNAAEAHFKKAIALDPQYLEAYIALAFIYESKRQVDDVQKIYADMLQQNPGRAMALDSYGCFLFRLGKLPDAKKRLEEALQCEADHVDAHVHLAIVCEQMGEIESAMTHYETALRLQPDLKDVETQLHRLRQGRKDQSSPR